MINIQYIVKAQKEREAASEPKVVVTPTQKPKPQKDKADDECSQGICRTDGKPPNLSQERQRRCRIE